MADADLDRLTPEEVLQLIDFMDGSDPIIVGGQSLNIWAQIYARRDPTLKAMGPFTSKDLDIYANKPAAESLASKLGNGRMLVAGLDDQTSNSAVVTGMLGDKRILVDFMATILGVEDASIRERYIGVAGDYDGREIKLLLMNPRDCVRSRLNNVNQLHREDDHSVNQASASLRVLRHFVDDLLDTGQLDFAQSILHELQYIIRDEHFGKATHRKFAGQIDPFEVAIPFLADERLDERWRRLILGRWIERERDRESRSRARMGKRAISGPDPRKR